MTYQKQKETQSEAQGKDYFSYLLFISTLIYASIVF